MIVTASAFWRQPWFWICVYGAAINLLGLICFGVDKQRARKGRWRIPERRLIGIAALGGSLGCLLGMYCFRHKTRHLKFTLGVPLILGVQVLLIAALCYLWH